ncbi:Stigma-specific protein Stig1 [Corchorus capsularis]|uniref:Stigma-specific protein Stig1 n=1 Tax=Corchorus capsularis TaxID=210143 RepID=A0A1R3GQA7_COCAP|nr:Stigma-specific protein Stig1 [Corchorus capsularis]
MILVLSIAATPNNLYQQDDDDDTGNYIAAEDQNDNDATSETEQVSDLSDDIETEGRLLLQKKRTKRLTCNKFPKICRAKGSPGPQCCKKKCVNILIDRQNCGKCGKKCKFSEICCKGKCVNPSFNRKHCGGCNNKCNNGGSCVFGLCDYA